MPCKEEEDEVKVHEVGWGFILSDSNDFFIFTPLRRWLTLSKLLLFGIAQASLALLSRIRNFRPLKTGGQY